MTCIKLHQIIKNLNLGHWTFVLNLGHEVFRFKNPLKLGVLRRHFPALGRGGTLVWESGG